MELELDLDGPPPLGPRQRQAVEQVDARDEVEGVGEGAGADLGRDRPLAEHHGRGVAVEAVGDQPLAVDVDRR